MSEDDGLRPRWLILYILATAIIAAILLLVPSNVVSYQATPLSTSTTAVIVVSTTTPSEPMVYAPAQEVVQVEQIPMYDPETERLLFAIGMCESGGQQFRPDGSVVKNPYSSATGKYQLMASIWRPIGERMGHDIDTEAGNKAMAYYILTEAQGIQAWSASASCLTKYNIFI